VGNPTDVGSKRHVSSNVGMYDEDDDAAVVLARLLPAPLSLWSFPLLLLILVNL